MLKPSSQSLLSSDGHLLQVNIPIVYGMLTAQTTPGMLFIHWVNQSYNTGVNYANRSGAVVDTTQILKSYALAVATSCSMAAGLGKVRGSLYGIIPSLEKAIR